MTKTITGKINGKDCNIEYTKVGDRFNISIDDPEVMKQIAPFFSIVDGKALFLHVTPNTQGIMNQIIGYINKNENTHLN